jgi:parallel beta-helix repeat protein
MKKKAVSHIMLILLLSGTFTWAFNIQPVGASSIWKEVARWTGSAFPTPAQFSIGFEISRVNWRIKWDYTAVGSFDFESLLLIQKNGELFIYDTSYFDQSGVRNVYNETGTFSLDATCLNMYAYTIIVEQDANSAYAQTAYIRADGSIDPPTMPISTLDNVTYNFIDNIYDWTVVVERDNIIIDGNGYALQGTKDRSIHWIDGIDLSGRTNVTVRNIHIKNFSNGIILNECSDNTISGNNITDSSQGIDLWKATGNRISANNITNSWIGIYLSQCSNNIINGNNIANSESDGMFLPYSSNNAIYHNNFINNTRHCVASNTANAFDNGYPSGGNYWAGYRGVDAKSGPNQDKPGSDGIGDTVYVVNENNTDRYPLMNTWVYTTKPTANAGQDKTVNVGTTVTFDGGDSTDDVGIVSYEWDFGDGTNGTGKTTTHVYTNPGTYTVTLTVKDAESNSASHQMTVTVGLAGGFPPWIIGAGAAIVAVGIAIAAALLLRKRKKPPRGNMGEGKAEVTSDTFKAIQGYLQG